MLFCSMERLRLNDLILGYRKKMGNQWFYSPDMYAWSGTEIPFEQKDRSSGFRDKNRRLLFVHDLVLDAELGILEIVQDEITGMILMIELNQGNIVPEFSVRKKVMENSLQWVSCSFLQSL